LQQAERLGYTPKFVYCLYDPLRGSDTSQSISLTIGGCVSVFLRSFDGDPRFAAFEVQQVTARNSQPIFATEFRRLRSWVSKLKIGSQDLETSRDFGNGILITILQHEIS
jgi:hypothetical protein